MKLQVVLAVVHASARWMAVVVQGLFPGPSSGHRRD